jgi:hypothetical protein
MEAHTPNRYEVFVPNPESVIKLRKWVERGKVTCEGCNSHLAIAVFSAGTPDGEILFAKAFCPACMDEFIGILDAAETDDPADLPANVPQWGTHDPH